ncbi:MAG: hypothetical protein U0324_33430 [Polyangiales bacterium]
MTQPPLPPRGPHALFLRGSVRRGEATTPDERRRLADSLRALRGVRRAAAVTGDPRDLAALQRDGLTPSAWPLTPARGDLVVAVEADSADAAVDALARIDSLLATAMPPGCANVVRPGPVAVLGSSEGALREVTTLVHHYGAGVSCAVRTREHDLSGEGGGRSTLAALEALEGDPDTGVLVLVSAPPAPAVAARVLDRARATGAKVVAAFLGYTPPARHPDVAFVATLEDAARAAASMAGAGTVSNHPTLRVTIPRFTREQRWLRGLYASGSLAWEAVTVLGPALRPASNLREGGAFFGALNDPSHLVVDLGDDALCKGRGHPRVELESRLEAIRSVANDPTSMVLLMDVPLGARAHENPAAVLAPALREARAQVAARGGTLVVVASVTGTDGDPQVQSRQIHALVSAGVEVCSSNAAAARRARAVALGEWL